MKSPLYLPVPVRALGVEVRALKDYVAQGLLTEDEAQERLADWEIFYPPGWHRVELLADARRHQPIPVAEYCEAAE